MIKLIVGLGNKGKEYENTRHNVGFKAIDKIAENFNIAIDKKKFDGLYNEVIINNQKVIFLKPQRYINLSGDVIKKYIDFYKIDIEDILIIHDDLDLPCGTIKIKYKGSSGGHNGLKNIENNIKTTEYKRIKIGISKDKTTDTKEYVLGKITSTEKEIIDKTINIIPEIFNYFLNEPFEKVMNKYNVKA